ncbi:hypothetical protein M408DRAFT_30301 [Serendipita vermifera MAFF 305830]|uniref:AB hydrolase-1 domain-containing protein n=1 Tax=Serendipita vermifera MAFF 305830 TaxID=933852 RepID=A0A0C2W1X7_SERVB|nr:hypothetical protein M408DRAFT_30301 [Serendipita vermifera MAFF 305830]
MPASAGSPHGASQSRDTLSWGACAGYPSPHECSTFQVPLDYARPSVGNTTLALIRLPAKTSPRKGYMFYNPGGPGGSGVDYIGVLGASLQIQLGEGWDIIGWDPRGVGGSGPDAPLFTNYAEYDAFWEQIEGTGKPEARGNLTQASDVAFFRSQVSVFDDFIKQFDAKYRAKSGDNLNYMGTCAVVRDLVGMVDAIYGRGADVNFYGYSYGTLIAAYLTQMFPHRVGKVIADGVLDAFTWTRTPITTGNPIDFTDTEKVLQAWSTACASSANCALATLGNHTADGVMRVIDGILNTSYDVYDGSKLSLYDFIANGTAPTYSFSWSFYLLTSFVDNLLHVATNWQYLDLFLSGAYAMQNNATTALGTRSEAKDLLTTTNLKLSRGSLPRQWADLSSVWSQAGFAIACGDSQRPLSNYTTATLFEEVIQVAQGISPHFGTLLNVRWLCPGWTTRAVERLGDIRGIPYNLNIKPKNVVLVIGNSADPVTPFASAQALASKKRLGSKARLVKFNAIGHATTSNPSACIDNVIRSYIEGNPPEDKGDDGPDVVCEVDSTPFDNPSA